MNKKKTFYNFDDINESERGWTFYNTAFKAWEKINSNLVGSDILDVGCGSGIMMGLIKLFNPEINIIGLEGDAHSKDIWIQRRLNVKIGDIYNLPFDDCEIDTVYSSNVIEHLESPIDSLKEMKRITRNRLITVVPDGNVDDKNFGTKHLQYYNRINILELHNKLDMKLIHSQAILDNHMNQIIVVYDK